MKTKNILPAVIIPAVVFTFFFNSCASLNGGFSKNDYEALLTSIRTGDKGQFHEILQKVDNDGSYFIAHQSQIMEAAFNAKTYPYHVSHLVDAGLSADTRIGSNNPIINIAASRNDYELVEFLLEEGADPNLGDGTAPPIVQLVYGRSGEYENKFDRKEALYTLKILLEHGADISVSVSGYDYNWLWFLAAEAYIKTLESAGNRSNRARLDPEWIDFFTGYLEIIRRYPQNCARHPWSENGSQRKFSVYLKKGLPSKKIEVTVPKGKNPVESFMTFRNAIMDELENNYDVGIDEKNWHRLYNAVADFGRLEYPNAETGPAEFENRRLFSDGSAYIEDKRLTENTAKGTYFFANGWKYVGEFKNNVMHGRGILYDDKGKIYFSGEFVNDFTLKDYEYNKNAERGSITPVLEHHTEFYKILTESGHPTLGSTRIFLSDEEKIDATLWAYNASKDYNNPVLEAVILKNMARQYLSIGNHGLAIGSVKKALEQALQIGELDLQVECLAFLADNAEELDLEKQKYTYYEQAIELVHKRYRRLEREQRAGFYSKYGWVFSRYAADLAAAGSHSRAIEIFESASDNYLADQLGLPEAESFSIDDAFDMIGTDTDVLFLVESDSTVRTIWLYGGSRHISGVNSEFFKGRFKEYIKEYASLFKKYEIPTGGIGRTELSLSALRLPPVDDFERSVRLYRRLLQNPSTTSEELKAMDALSSHLGILFAGVGNNSISEKGRNLVIVANGILSYIPFETVKLHNGLLGVEQYDISYISSLRLYKYLQTRQGSVGNNPRVLACGDAAYTGQAEETEGLTEPDIQVLIAKVSDSISRGAALDFAYQGLGYADWSSLPGTRKEVGAIDALFDNADVLLGEEFSEQNIKALSSSGRLGTYNFLHFASHGMAVQEEPSLSALVFSQGGLDDGYLLLGEIENLEVNADLVALSACETGLGKIYRGESVVALPQAWLLAGAKSVCASLWKVDDEATMIFMIGVYSLLKETDLSIPEAVAEMKRVFLTGKIPGRLDAITRGLASVKNRLTDSDKTVKTGYANPYYWAPFKYYGCF